MPLEKILEKIEKMFLDWERDPAAERDGKSWRFRCSEQADDWANTHFWIFEHGRETEAQREHQLLCFGCHNMSEEQIHKILECMGSFRCPLQIREERRA